MYAYNYWAIWKRYKCQIVGYLEVLSNFLQSKNRRNQILLSNASCLFSYIQVKCVVSITISCWDSIWNFALSASAILKTYPSSITSSTKVIIMIYLTRAEMRQRSTCLHIKVGEDRKWFVCLFPLTWLSLHSNIDIDMWPIRTESASTGIRIAGGGLLYAHFNTITKQSKYPSLTTNRTNGITLHIDS